MINEFEKDGELIRLENALFECFAEIARNRSSGKIRRFLSMFNGKNKYLMSLYNIQTETISNIRDHLIKKIKIGNVETYVAYWNNNIQPASKVCYPLSFKPTVIQVHNALEKGIRKGNIKGYTVDKDGNFILDK